MFAKLRKNQTKFCGFKTVDVSFNRIKRLRKGTFAGLLVYSELNLEQNGIEYIENGAFAGATMQKLLLKGNPLNIIQPGAFDNMFGEVSELRLVS